MPVPDHVTTALRNEARDGVEALEKAFKFLTGPMDGIVSTLLEIDLVHQDEVAKGLLERYQGVVGSLGEAAASRSNIVSQVISIEH